MSRQEQIFLRSEEKGRSGAISENSLILNQRGPQVGILQSPHPRPPRNGIESGMGELAQVAFEALSDEG